MLQLCHRMACQRTNYRTLEAWVQDVQQRRIEGVQPSLEGELQMYMPFVMLLVKLVEPLQSWGSSPNMLVLKATGLCRG